MNDAIDRMSRALSREFARIAQTEGAYCREWPSGRISVEFENIDLRQIAVELLNAVDVGRQSRSTGDHCASAVTTSHG